MAPDLAIRVAIICVVSVFLCVRGGAGRILRGRPRSVAYEVLLNPEAKRRRRLLLQPHGLSSDAEPHGRRPLRGQSGRRMDPGSQRQDQQCGSAGWRRSCLRSQASRPEQRGAVLRHSSSRGLTQSTYRVVNETAHLAARRCGGGVAVRGASPATGDAGGIALSIGRASFGTVSTHKRF
jgi:hypothetical protein